jgi:type IV secretory pathway VirJ component
VSEVFPELVSRAQQKRFFLVQSLRAGLAMVRDSRTAVSLAALLLCQCTSLYTAPPSEEISYRRFDRIYLYQPQAHASHLALLLSGDGGWSGMLGGIGQRLAAGGTLVAGIDVRHLLASFTQDPASCVSPGAELEALARYLQLRYGTGRAAPTLIGHSAGATLALVALAQSDPGAFAGAITLSFCADLDLAKPLCPNPGAVPLPRSGGVRLQPPAALPAPWIALHGLDDEVCPPEDSRTFATAIPGAHFVALPGVDHGYRNFDRWWPQFAAAYQQILR